MVSKKQESILNYIDKTIKNKVVIDKIYQNRGKCCGFLGMKCCGLLGMKCCGLLGMK